MGECEQRVRETLMRCQERKEPFLVWEMEVVKCLESFGLGGSLPSPELGQVLVFQLCFENNHPSLWKFLEYALSRRLISPIHVLSLLTCRIIPYWASEPVAYRLYLELVSRYAYTFDPPRSESCREKIVKSVDDALQLSKNYGVHVLEYGQVAVLFFFSIVIGLIDNTLGDWGSQMTSLDSGNEAKGSADCQYMEIDSRWRHNFQRNEHQEHLRRTNSFLAVDVLEKLTDSKKATALLHLVHINMPEIFNGVLQRLRLLEAPKLESSDFKSVNHCLARLSANIQKVLGFQFQLHKRQLIGVLNNTGSWKPVSCCNSESAQSACWVHFDIYMESAMSTRNLPVRPVIDTLTEGILTLQLFNRGNWQDTFLALWLSALRLVQRIEGSTFEGPLTNIESRLSVLLSIVPLAIAKVLEDETKSCSSSLQEVLEIGYTEASYQPGMDGMGHASRKHGLISSLQVLAQFSDLLHPPASVVDAANDTAAKAASLISKSKNVEDGLHGESHDETSIRAGGNLRHLIVEACISRNLLDSSAYFWPGYVSASVITQPNKVPLNRSPWLTLMEGAPLNVSLINSLITTPASSLAEIEKVYHMALDGSGKEKSAAAEILCGASLSRSWNIQEHVARFVVKLLSSLVLQCHPEKATFIDDMSMLCAILWGSSYVDSLQILSLHGLVPEVAAVLVPLCEASGSLQPTSTDSSNMGDEPLVYQVFSCAFLFLLRLWKFYKAPINKCFKGQGEEIGSELTLEYLLLLWNSHISNHENAPDKALNMGSYPKLRAWYRQHKSYTASPVPDLCTGDPVNQLANNILGMIHWKITQRGASSTNSSTPSRSNCGTSANSGQDQHRNPVASAWEVLEAIPFVLKALLTACALGSLSSQDLTTGLKCIADFLPASIAIIISYFTAEVTRGVWKPVPMNGTDWPSPAAMLPLVTSEMKEILSAAGVNAPNSFFGDSPLSLPLPVAAILALTLTHRINKGPHCTIDAVVGLSMASCASDCPGPIMLIVMSLWAQKIRRWHEFNIMLCTRSVFRQNKEAVSKLLKSCFASFFGSPLVSTFSFANRSSVSGLLGNNFTVRDFYPSIPHGFLYLFVGRSINNFHCVNDIILLLVVEYAQVLVSKWEGTESSNLKYSQVSLSRATSMAKEVAMLGASLICVTGEMQLVKVLFQETIPMWFLSSREEKHSKVSSVSCILVGYAVAYLVVLSGSIVYGVRPVSPSWTFSRRAKIVSGHMDFIAQVLESNISLGCNPTTWKAYVCCLVGLLVNFAPMWIKEVEPETLKKLACALRLWDEYELALSLLERGGVAAMGSVVELVNVIYKDF